jgi:hypothetical protein
VYFFPDRIYKIDWIFFWAFYLPGRKEENSIRLRRKTIALIAPQVVQEYLDYPVNPV